MAFTTDEVWMHMRRPEGAPDSVHLALFPKPEELTAGLSEDMRARVGNWDRLLPVRDQVLKSLEAARQDKFIGTGLEARVRISANGDLLPLLAEYEHELPAWFIVSQVDLSKGGSGELGVTVERAQGVKCERCWKYRTDVGSDPEFPTICAPCAEAVREIMKESE